MTLQERLAASIAKSRNPSPKITGDEGRVGVDISSGVQSEVPASPERTETPQLPGSLEQKDTNEMKEETETPVILDQIVSVEEKDRADSISVDLVQSGPSDPESDIISQLRTDLQTCESQRIEESQQYSARISSLEEKLKLMSEITSTSASEILSNPESDVWERKLADREEKIVRLLDEGEKLAKIELNLTTVIKSLRAKQKEDANTVTTSLSRADKAERQLSEIKLQLKKANEIEKKNTERLKSMYKIEAANEALRREKENAQVLPVSQESLM
jgi:hypothetical protein